LLIRSVRGNVEAQQGAQELDGIVVPELDRPLLIGLSGRKGVVRVTATQDNVGSYTRGPVDLKTIAVLLDSLDGDSVDTLSGESSDGGEKDDWGDHLDVDDWLFMMCEMRIMREGVVDVKTDDEEDSVRP
jgi:hypothetical protein